MPFALSLSSLLNNHTWDDIIDAWGKAAWNTSTCEFQQIITKKGCQVLEENANSRQWYALRVRSRHEFVTYNELCRKGIEAYLPTVKKWSQWKDRKKLVEFPLFSGYLFANINIDSQEYFNTLKTKGAVNILSLEGGRPAPVAPDEIHSLRILVGSGEELDIYPHIEEGTKVMVKRGLLKGATGILTRKEANYVFSVEIVLLGKSVGAKVLADDVETV